MGRKSVSKGFRTAFSTSNESSKEQRGIGALAPDHHCACYCSALFSGFSILASGSAERSFFPFFYFLTGISSRDSFLGALAAASLSAFPFATRRVISSCAAMAAIRESDFLASAFSFLIVTSFLIASSLSPFSLSGPGVGPRQQLDSTMKEPEDGPKRGPRTEFSAPNEAL
jgi:hypothetical protein